MKTEIITLNEERNVTLTVYNQSVGGEFRNIEKRPAILILPGGGYQMCSDREADPVAMPYLKAGYQVFILRYSIKKDAQWPNPLNDYDQAMAMIRDRALEWCLYPDKVAVIGFSAGGHLAACAATMSVNRPNAAILGYAVTIGEAVKGCNQTAPDTVSAVDGDTCPCFLFSTRDDSIVPIVNSIDFMKALAQYDIAFESHIYAYGPHGFSTGDPSVMSPTEQLCSRAPQWVQDSVSWLEDMFGSFAYNEMTEPVCKGKINRNSEEYYSIDCTIAYLLSDEITAKVVNPILEGMKQLRSADQGQEDEGMDMSFMMMNLKLRDVLAFGGTAPDVLAEIDSSLRGIIK